MFISRCCTELEMNFFIQFTLFLFLVHHSLGFKSCVPPHFLKSSCKISSLPCCFVHPAQNHDILVKSLKGLPVPRPPVWLYRQVILSFNFILTCFGFSSFLLTFAGRAIHDIVSQIFRQIFISRKIRDSRNCSWTFHATVGFLQDGCCHHVFWWVYLFPTCSLHLIFDWGRYFDSLASHGHRLQNHFWKGSKDIESDKIQRWHRQHSPDHWCGRASAFSRSHSGGCPLPFHGDP